MFPLKKWRHYLFGLNITAHTDHSLLSTWETNRGLSERHSRSNEVVFEFPVPIIIPLGQRNVLAYARSRRPDHELLEITALQNPSVAIRIRDMHPKEGYFENVHKYFSVAWEDEPSPSSVISVITWFSIDPKIKLMFYIRDHSDHRVCISMDSTLLHDLQDVPFAVQNGATRVYAHLRKLSFNL
jgi:hypothetical protein